MSFKTVCSLPPGSRKLLLIFFSSHNTVRSAMKSVLSTQAESFLGHQGKAMPKEAIDENDGEGHHQGAGGENGIALLLHGLIDNRPEAEGASLARIGWRFPLEQYLLPFFGS